MLGLEGFNRLIRIVQSGSQAIFTVPQGVNEPPARARLNTLDLWNSFDAGSDEDSGDVVPEIDFDPFASIKKRRHTNTMKKRANSRRSIKKASFKARRASPATRARTHAHKRITRAIYKRQRTLTFTHTAFTTTMLVVTTAPTTEGTASCLEVDATSDHAFNSKFSFGTRP
jgi:hypothetical protein